MEAAALFSRQGLLVNEELYKYLLNTNVYPRENKHLKDLREATKREHQMSFMTTPADGGQLLSLLLQTMNAKKTIEIGVYTGYSLLLTALSIPDDGKITAIDKDRSSYDMGLPYIREAGVEHKINFIESDGLQALDQLLADENNHGSYDFAFVDADKENYIKYHNKVRKLIKVGGMVVYDDTLWFGTVAMPDHSLTEELNVRSYVRFVKDFNQFIANDSAFQISQVPLGGGMTICRRLH